MRRTLKTAIPFVFAALMTAVFSDAVPAAAHDAVVPLSSVGSAAPLAKPTLTAGGPALIVSDSPESLEAPLELPGALYRDTTTGPVRVLGHQQNNRDSAVTMGVAVTNPGDRPLMLFRHGTGTGVDYAPDVAGQLALGRFLADHDKVRYLTTLQPHETWWDSRLLEPTLTVSTLDEYDAVALTGPNSPSVTELTGALAQPAPELPAASTWGKLTVTTVAYTGPRPPSDPTALAVLPYRAPQIRATFAHGDLTGSFSVHSGQGVRKLAVDTAAPGHPYSDPMPGEYELGYDAVDSYATYNSGNYGVLYHFDIDLVNDEPGTAAAFALLMTPSGGAGHFLDVVDGSQALSPYVDYTHAWWYADRQTNGGHTEVQLETSLTGGSAGPQTLLFAPGYSG